MWGIKEFLGCGEGRREELRSVTITSRAYKREQKGSIIDQYTNNR